MSLKILLQPEVRVSMIQTCMNVSGGNFHGSRTPSKKVLDYAFELYNGMVKQLLASEKNQVLVPKVSQIIRPTKQETNKLLNKVSKKKLTKKRR